MAKFTLSAFADEASKDINEQIVALKENGIDHIELRGINGKNIADFTVEEAKSLKTLLDTNGIKVSSIGSPYGKIEITDDFAPHFEAFKNTVEVAKILETDYIRIFSFYFRNGEDYNEYKDEVIRRVGEMARYAKSQGITCCHENEKNIYGDVPQRCREVIDAIGEDIGCIFDPANFIECGVEVLPAYGLLEDRITYFHVKDARHADKQITPAGKGDANFVELLKLAAQHQVPYFLTLEPHLKVFEGLEALEASNDTINKLSDSKAFHYSSSKESFKAACDAIKEVLAQVTPIKLGIVGYGNMGSGHMNNFLKGRFKEVVITAIADIKPERLEAAKKDLPGVAVFNTATELFDSGLCDSVLIATPHYFHPPLSIEALNKGLNVISEKPAGVYTKQVKEMNAVAEKSDKVFTMMFNQRTNPAYQKMREIVKSGEYGEIKRVNWIITDWYRTQYYYNSGGWRATWAGEGGGVLLNQCPHNLDLWQWICGMPSKIRATCHIGKWHDIEVEDDVTIYAEYPNGATGVFITSTGDAPGTNRLEITMDKGKLVYCEGKLILDKLACSTSEHIKTATSGFTKPDCERIEIPLPEGSGEQHVGIINAFAAHVLRGEPMYADGTEGINGLTISNAAHLSSWLGKDIELPFDDDLFYEELQKRVATSKIKTNVNEGVASDMDNSFAK
ncbi:MAG: TIM barrel protein [Clostridiales bacterium]|nr:TIM barrel protein [Clostridiales bacterium]